MMDLTKCAYAEENQASEMDDVHKKYLLGTYNQEEAMQLIKKFVKTIAGQKRN